MCQKELLFHMGCGVGREVITEQRPEGRGNHRHLEGECSKQSQLRDREWACLDQARVPPGSSTRKTVHSPITRMKGCQWPAGYSSHSHSSKACGGLRMPPCPPLLSGSVISAGSVPDPFLPKSLCPLPQAFGIILPLLNSVSHADLHRRLQRGGLAKGFAFFGLRAFSWTNRRPLWARI